MYPISDLFTKYLKESGRNFLVKAEINGTEYGNDVVVEFTVDNSLVLGEEFEIGTTTLSELIIKLRTEDEIPPNARIVPYLALTLPPQYAGAEQAWQDVNVAWQDAGFLWGGAVTEWLPLGEFFVDSRERVNDTWVYTCFDRLVWADVAYVSSLTYPTTQQAVWDEICGRLGYVYDSSVGINPAFQIQAGPAGYSMRQVLGYIASANGASVFVGKDGVIKFRRFVSSEPTVFEMTASDYIRAATVNPVKTYTRVVVTYNTEDGLTYEAGTGDDNHTLYVENPFATQTITDALFAQLNGFSYQPVTMDARGFPQIEAGDRIRFGQAVDSPAWQDADTAWQDTAYSWDGFIGGGITLALHMVFSFKGGLKMSLEAPSKSEQQSEFVVEGSLTQQVNKINRDAVWQGKSYFGVTVTRTDGLIVEREDHASKAIFNSDKISMQAGGVDKIYFDPVSGKYKFNGTLEASDGVFSGTLSAANGSFSGTLVAANGTFTGTLVGVDGEFSGTISASTITGGTINGTTITGSLIQTSASYPRAAMNNASNLFGAYKDANNYIEMNSNYIGAPVINVASSGAIRGQVGSSSGGTNDLFVSASSILNLRSGGDIYLDPGVSGGKVRTSWSELIDGAITLQSELNDKQGSADAWTSYGYNLTFDPSTRNLKMFNRFGSQIAIVNIP
ncbi:polymer-forming cytoskeletal protein [Cohnella suwonensis]|uniref:Polymer-forming cytoskeletal protein n=1 Tax=Cohnella suwonensis TaxID=696072 RepID=A0ABW0LTS5_9BACL